MPIRLEYAAPGLAGLAGLLGGVGKGRTIATAEANQTQRIAMQIASQQKIAGARIQAQRASAAAAQSAASKRQAASLNAQRASQRQQIQAQSQRDMQAADTAYKRMAVQAGLQGELKEQAFDLEIQKMEEEARQRASQRKEIVTEEGAKNQAAANRLRQIIEDPDSPFSQGEREQMKQKEVGLRNNVLTQVTDLTPKPPPEYALWSSGIMEDGTGRPYDVDGDGKRTIGKSEDTSAGMKAKRDHEIVLKRLEADQKLIDNRDSFFRERLETPVKYRSPEGEDFERDRTAVEAAREAWEQYPAPAQPEHPQL